MSRISPVAGRARAAFTGVAGDALSRGLTQGAIKVFVLKGWAAGFGIVATWILSRSSTPAEFGTYASVLSVVALLGIPAALGFDSYLVPASAWMLAQHRHGRLRGLLQRSRDLTLVASLALVLAGAVLPLPALLGIAVGPYLVGLLSLPVGAQSRLRQATLTGVHHAIAGQLPESVVRPSVLALLAAAMVVSIGHLTGLAMVTANLLAVTAAYGVGVWLQRRYLPREVVTAVPEFETAPWTRAAIHFVALSGANQVMLNVPLIAIGLIRGPAEAALFAMALRLATLVLFGYEAVNTVLAPATAKLWAEGDLERLQKIVTFTARLALVSTLPAAVVFLAAGQWVLSFFGPAYALAAPALAILTVGQMLNAATGNVMLLLKMTGYQSRGAAAQIAVAAASIPLALVLVASLGVNGAALSYVIALLAVNLLWMWQVRRNVGVASTALGQVRPRTR
jgi:O-antigen/teichoic acid export membrane protein